MQAHLSSTLEIEMLDESALDDSPKCEMFMVPDFTRQCGKPSVARIQNHCACGKNVAVFVCREDLDKLKVGLVRCHFCRRKIVNWTYA